MDFSISSCAVGSLRKSLLWFLTPRFTAPSKLKRDHSVFGFRLGLQGRRSRLGGMGKLAHTFLLQRTVSKIADWNEITATERDGLKHIDRRSIYKSHVGMVGNASISTPHPEKRKRKKRTDSTWKMLSPSPGHRTDSFFGGISFFLS